MSARISDSLQKKISQRLNFYDDLGVCLFYKNRATSGARVVAEPATQSFDVPVNQQISHEEAALPKSTRKSEPLAVTSAQPPPRVALPPPLRVPGTLPVPAGPSLFEAFDKVPDDNLLKIRTDLGECTRCKLHQTRN